jgi:hypothetical protein
MTSRLFLNDDHLILDFPYDASQVAEVKLVHGAKWDKLAKVWRVPMGSLHEARDFATKHEFDIDSEVLLFDLPKPDNNVFGIRKEDDWIYLSFAYDPVKVKAVKTIASITWHAKTKAWRAPLSSIHEVIDWASTFREKLPTELSEMATDLRTRHEASVEKSRATEGTIDVAGLPLLPYQKAGV